MENNEPKAFATSKNIRISPSKIDKIISRIRGKTYKEALQILKFLPQKSGVIVWQTLYSAVSNAANNLNLEKEKMIVSEAFVNQGPTAKRVLCGSKGSPKKREKKTSHVTIKVSIKN